MLFFHQKVNVAVHFNFVCSCPVALSEFNVNFTVGLLRYHQAGLIRVAVWCSTRFFHLDRLGLLFQTVVLWVNRRVEILHVTDCTWVPFGLSLLFPRTSWCFWAPCPFFTSWAYYFPFWHSCRLLFLLFIWCCLVWAFRFVYCPTYSDRIWLFRSKNTFWFVHSCRKTELFIWKLNRFCCFMILKFSTQLLNPISIDLHSMLIVDLWLNTNLRLVSGAK